MNEPVKNTLWIVFLLLATSALSIQFACAMPFAALATIGVLTLQKRMAFALVAIAWAVNQAIGYGLLGYPTDSSSFMWGGIIGLSAIIGLYVCTLVNSKLSSTALSVRLAALFAAAFLGYQGTMYIAAWLLGDMANFTLAITGQVLAVNVLALAGLSIANHAFNWLVSANQKEVKAS